VGVLTREDLERREEELLLPGAARSRDSRGRDHAIAHDRLRTDYQRDRDRIVHCAAFRKLEYKTQVYVIHEGDYYRTRLTHTMEVSQIARTLAGSLRLNGDLTEAIALAHDVGHTPFGHSGENVLNRLMEGEGGFDHNRQGIEVVERLERRYRDFPGLNLTWEVREGIAKHCTTYDAPESGRFEPELQPTLEAQAVEVADEIAYNHHDLDDALKMGILTRHDLKQVDWIAAILDPIESATDDGSPDADRAIRFRVIGEMIERTVRDVLETSDRNICDSGVDSLDAVRRCGRRLVAFGPDSIARNRTLGEMLMRKVYRHPLVMRMAVRGERFIEQLFGLYLSNPRQLPFDYQQTIDRLGVKRAIADYISGMTDRYCIEEYRRAFVPDPGMR
jgi:dGTPase